MLGSLHDLTINRDGTQNITVTVSADFTNTFDSLKNGPVSVEIKKAGKGRSKDANALCWALCSEIGKAMTPPLAKEEVYRDAIRAVGVYTQTQLVAWDIPQVKARWESHGTGWFLEVVDDSILPGHKTVNLYYGSSTYTVDEMRLLIEWLMDNARQMQIPIPLSKRESEELEKTWGVKV